MSVVATCLSFVVQCVLHYLLSCLFFDVVVVVCRCSLFVVLLFDVVICCLLIVVCCALFRVSRFSFIV